MQSIKVCLLGFLITTLTISTENALSSDFGTVGLIDIPTARMSADGTLTTSAAFQSRTNSYSLTYQATPWLEGTFRYTGFNDFFYYDRNYEVKIKLLNETVYLPQLAVGIRDIVGTGIYGSEYLVASKKIKNFDFTLGMGWGRLAGKGDLRNPLRFISSKFENRQLALGGMGTTGIFQPGQWFSGEKAGIFGGVKYHFGSLPLTAEIEFNPDQYEWDVDRGAPTPNSPLTAALTWESSKGYSVSISRQHGQEWGIGLLAKLDTKTLPNVTKRPKIVSSLDLDSAELPRGINKNSWYDTLLYDVERSGILILEASINYSGNIATIVMGNIEYVIWQDALRKMIELADIHLPLSVSKINIIVEEEGHRLHSVTARRPSFNFGSSQTLADHKIKVSPVRSFRAPQYKTNFVRKKVFLDLSLANRVQLFDPDDPLRYQLFVKVGLSTALPKSILLTGTYSQNISSNFDESLRKSNSVLPRVRSDVVEYLQQGISGIDSLYLQKRGNIDTNVFYRIYGGLLETMYSGLGGEVVYQPYRSRFAFGLSGNIVKQRDFDKSFKHLDYKTVTAFGSIYWATPFYNFDIALHAGKYLARDIGFTLEVRRTFHNGWMVGLWGTKTNVSAEDFGEGSFDKGLFFKVPLSTIFGAGTRSSYSTRMRPIQRDGGQYLEDFSNNIWWDTRTARFDAFSDTVYRFNK